MLDALPMSAVSAGSLVARGFGLSDLDEATKRLARLVIQGVDRLKAYNSKMAVSYLQALLMVAENEGLSVQEYAKRAGVVPSTMSRILLDLGEKNRDGTPGLRFVKRIGDIEDMRSVSVVLTPLGRKLVEDMLGPIRDRSAL